MELVENAVVAGRFRLNRMLGRGGMGSVWHATHLGLDIPCAVKFIEGEFATIPEAAVRFEREAKAAAQLRSPHVVQILDHGVSEGRPYIAMELLDGEDLGKRLQARGKLAPPEINVIIAQVCRALTKAHSLGIVHRDLKPDNIFLVRDDDREIAKVLDFGIAKSGNSMETGSNTRTGAMLGTPYYMSPEQAQGIKSVDYRSDLWSLAVIAFQCVTGRLPFESEALGDLLVKIIVAPIPVPSQFGHVPAAFDAWWARAASRDPNQRFQSAKEFADSLALSIGGSSVTDVIDMRAVLAGARQGAQQTGPGVAPGSDPRFGSDPGLGGAAANLPQTPNPFGAPPGGGTPVSAMAESLAVRDPSAFHNPQPVSATTGAPIARTYSDVGMQAAQRKKGPVGLFIGLGVAGFVVVGLVIGAFAFHSGKGGSAAAGEGASASAPVNVTPPPTEPPSAAPPPVTPPVTPPVAAAAASSAEPVAAATPPPPTGASKSTSATSSTRKTTATTTTTTPGTTATAAKTGGSKEVKAVESMGF